MHGRDPASVYSQRWRWSTVQTAHEGYPLIGISTSSTILSLARYRLGSIKSPIPWRASRWLRLQGRPRAHQSEPAPNRRYWFPRLHCYRASIQPTCHDDDEDDDDEDSGGVYDRRARMEDVSAAKVLHGGRSGHRKGGTRWKRIYGKILKLGIAKCGEIYWKSYQPCPSRMVPLLLVERRDIYLNETFARDLLGHRSDLSVMWIFLLFSFLGEEVEAGYRLRLLIFLKSIYNFRREYAIVNGFWDLLINWNKYSSWIYVIIITHVMYYASR